MICACSIAKDQSIINLVLYYSTRSTVIEYLYKDVTCSSLKRLRKPGIKLLLSSVSLRLYVLLTWNHTTHNNLQKGYLNKIFLWSFKFRIIEGDVTDGRHYPSFRYQEDKGSYLRDLNKIKIGCVQRGPGSAETLYSWLDTMGLFIEFRSLPTESWSSSPLTTSPQI